MYRIHIRFHVRNAFVSGESNCFRLWCEVLDAAISNAVWILTQIFHEQLGADGERTVGPRVIRIHDEILVPFIASFEHLVGELCRGVIAEVQTIDMNWLVGPLTCQPELSPGPDVILGTSGKFGI